MPGVKRIWRVGLAVLAVSGACGRVERDRDDAGAGVVDATPPTPDAGRS